MVRHTFFFLLCSHLLIFWEFHMVVFWPQSPPPKCKEWKTLENWTLNGTSILFTLRRAHDRSNTKSSKAQGGRRKTAPSRHSSGLAGMTSQWLQNHAPDMRGLKGGRWSLPNSILSAISCSQSSKSTALYW